MRPASQTTISPNPPLLIDHLRGRTIGPHDRQILLVHHIADGHQQAPAQTAARVQTREIDAREAAQLHQRHGQRITHGELGRRGGRGREVKDASLLLHPDIEVHVGILGQRRFAVARHGDQKITRHNLLYRTVNM